MPGSETAMGSDKLNFSLRSMEQYGLIKMTHLAPIGWADLVKATTRPSPQSHVCQRATAPAPSGGGEVSRWAAGTGQVALGVSRGWEEGRTAPNGRRTRCLTT